VMCGRYDQAPVLIDACEKATRRLRLEYVTMYLQMTRAVQAAHRARRRAMEEALAAFHASGGEQAPEQALALGMGEVFCALLEEDRERSRDAFTRLQRSEEDAPSIFSLSGRHGLRVLVDVLDGTLDPAGFAEISASAMAGMRWNRQFVVLARAVLAGRDGRQEDAADAMAESLAVSAIYPMTRHLGLRLVAEAAVVDGWGEPETWLRQAEEYFHQIDVPAVASACRALLRQTGAAVWQRRTGTDRVPAALRALGVTAREFEVFQLLVDRIGNKAIANRLHISPRTVEKHIASLVTKTGRSDRDALHDYAAAMLGD
jgi:DNA-binding CsgD family transcriptional regulator